MAVPKNTDWAQRAFLKVEAALLDRMASHAAHNITEETLRDALFRGLSEAEPQRQSHVKPEGRVAWHENLCFSCQKKPGSGKRKAHDVVVDAHQYLNHPANPGLVCEVKWLKKNQRREGEILADILRLALTRGAAKEGSAARTFLLVGGESKTFGRTIRALETEKVTLRWAPSGNQSTPDLMPGDTKLNLRLLLKRSKLAQKEFQALMVFTGGHYRLPPDLWRTYKIALRCRWLQTSGNRSWRMALWELHRWGVDSKPLPGKELARKFRPLHQRRRRRRKAKTTKR